MSLKDKITEDIKSAMKAGEAEKLTTLRMVSAALTNKEKENQAAAYKDTDNNSIQDIAQASLLSDEEVLEVIGAEAKKRKDAIEQYESAGDNDRVASEKSELEILGAYLPEQMSEEDVRKIVEETVAEVGASSPQDIGKVMGALMPKVKGKADGGLVSKLVQEALK